MRRGIFSEPSEYVDQGLREFKAIEDKHALTAESSRGVELRGGDVCVALLQIDLLLVEPLQDLKLRLLGSDMRDAEVIGLL